MWSKVGRLVENYPFLALYQWLRKRFSFCFAFKFCLWCRYNICLCMSAAFVAGLLSSYYVVDYAVVGFLTTYFTDEGTSGNVLVNATLLKNFQGFLTAIFEFILTYVSYTSIGRLKTVLFSSASYITGLVLLAFLKIPESKFWLMNTMLMVPLAMGKAGKEPLKELASDQLRNHEPEQEKDEDRVEVRQIVWSRVAWFIAAILIYTYFTNIELWSDAFAASAMGIGITCVLLCCGFYLKRRKARIRAAFLMLSAILISFTWWINVAWISLVGMPCIVLCDLVFNTCKGTNRVGIDENHLDSHPQAESDNKLPLSLPQDESPICKNKDTIVSVPDNNRSTKELCTVSPVKELLSTMLPTWIFMMAIGYGLSTADTFFSEQGNELGSGIPINLLLLMQTLSRYVTSLCHFIFCKWVSDDDDKAKRWKLVSIGVGMLVLVVCFLVAWRVEIHRLDIVDDNNLRYSPDKTIPMSTLLLAPQFCLLGVAASLIKDGLEDLFWPRTLQSLQKYVSSEVVINGSGNFLSIIFIQVLRPWFGSSLNESRLDNYYLFVAALNFINLCCWVLWTLYKGHYSAERKQNPCSMATAPLSTNIKMIEYV